MANIGDKVKIITKESEEEGVLMPSPDENNVIIKLSNGYNMGFEKKDVQEIQLISKKEEKEKKNPLLKKIMICLQ